VAEEGDENREPQRDPDEVLPHAGSSQMAKGG
jgi:hypothetical protein